MELAVLPGVGEVSWCVRCFFSAGSSLSAWAASAACAAPPPTFADTSSSLTWCSSFAPAGVEMKAEGEASSDMTRLGVCGGTSELCTPSGADNRCPGEAGMMPGVRWLCVIML